MEIVVALVFYYLGNNKKTFPRYFHHDKIYYPVLDEKLGNAAI